MHFIDFIIIGDPSFDFFFSVTASINVFMFIIFAFTSVFRGRV